MVFRYSRVLFLNSCPRHKSYSTRAYCCSNEGIWHTSNKYSFLTQVVNNLHRFSEVFIIQKINHFDLEKLFKVVISRGNGTKLCRMKRVIRLILNFSKGSYSIFGSHWDLENSSGRMRENSNFQISNKAFCKRWKEMKYSWFWNEQRNV